MAAIACLLLREQGAFPVDYVSIHDGGATANAVIPHVVAVIGRTANTGPVAWPADSSPLGLPDTWLADTVICDPWARTAYAAADYNQFGGGLRAQGAAAGALTCMLVHQI